MDPNTDNKPEETAPYNATPYTPPAEAPVAIPVENTASQPQPQPQPQIQPQQAPVPAPTAASVNTPGAIILQWLTYAFWGWLIAALIWLIAVILVNALLQESVNGVVPYAIAATVILFPIAFLCDLFYRKHEPAKKVGAAMVIMVIHAVLFALLCIGALITAAFMGVNMALNPADGDGLNAQLILLLTSLFAAILYAAAFLRTLNPFKSNLVPRAYSIAMLGMTIILIIATIAGPIASSIATRDDRRIEESLPSVSYAIGNYVSKNNKLPESLADIDLSDQKARALVDDGKVEYIAEGVKQSTRLRTTIGQETYRYQLCVEYAAKKGSSSRSAFVSSTDTYSSYISTYTHDAGRTCYKQETRGY